jgi:glyoxylase-like metal-dependent hydrolase (beta-lactamase superfamily II)
MTIMDATTYRFRIGDFECLALSDGQFVYAPPLFPPPARLLFTEAPEERVIELLQEDGTDLASWTEWTSPYTCLLVSTGDHLVLVDTGAGSLGPGTGRLIGSLAAEGIRPEDIDTIIFTHAHPDHSGGNISTAGDLLFPSARWVISEAEYEFWMGQEAERVLPPLEQVIVGMARRQFAPLKASIELVTGEAEVVPGIRLIPTPGHTPGHVAVGVTSGGDDLLCLGDLFLHPIHMEQPEWSGVVDVEPKVLAQSRNVLLSKASAGAQLLMCFHFPFPGLGRISQGGSGRRWAPAAR